LGLKAKVSALARGVKEDIDLVARVGAWGVRLSLPIGDLQRKYKLKWSDQKYIDTCLATTEYAKKKGLHVTFSPFDTTRVKLDFLDVVLNKIRESGFVDKVRLVDTVGAANPLAIKYLVKRMKDALGAIPIEIHCHNDFGLATANTLAAVEEGVAYVHTCIAGFGERAGAAPLEEVVTALELLYDLDTGIELDKLYRLSQLAEKTFALPVQFHKPIIGDNAFAYELDEHFEGALAQSLVYEPFPPEIIGREAQYFTYRQAGRKWIETRLAQAEVKTSPLQVEEILKRIRRMHESADKGEAQMTFYQIKKLMKDLRRGLSEDEFWKVVEEVTRQKPKLKPKETIIST